MASREAAKAAAYAREWGIERAHGSYEALLSDPGIDAVYIPLPNHLHAEWAIRAAARGEARPVREAARARRVSEVDAMEAAARENGVVLAEAFMYRHHPQTLKVKELVDGGAIGAVRFVRGTFSFPLEPPGRRPPPAGVGWRLPLGRGLLSAQLHALPARRRSRWRCSARRCSGRPGSTRRSPASSCFPTACSRRSTPASAARSGPSSRSPAPPGRSCVRHPWKPAPDLPILLTRGEETEAVAVAECDRYLLEIEDLARGRPHRPPAARQPRREPRQRGHDRGPARVRPRGPAGEAVAAARGLRGRAESPERATEERRGLTGHAPRR